MYTHKRLLALAILGLAAFVGMLTLAYWQFGKGLDKYWLIQKKPWHSHQLPLHTLQHKTTPATGKTQLSLSTENNISSFRGHGYIVSGQLRHKKSGYEVFAVIHNKPNNIDVLLALGWRNSPAQALKLLNSINLKQPLMGYFHKPSGKLWVKHPQNKTQSPVQFLSYLDMKTIRRNHPTIHPYVFYTLDSSMGQLMQEPTYFEKKMFKHISYALQFIVFGLLTLVYTLIFTLKRVPYVQAIPK